MMQIQSEAIKLLSRHEHGDTVALQWLVELETKVAEEYAKFYNHREGLLQVESAY